MQSKILRVLAVAMLAAALPLPARADQSLPNTLRTRQHEALAKLGKAAFEYADFCASAGALSEARTWYGAAIAITGSDVPARAAFAKIAGQPDKKDAKFQKDRAAQLGKITAAGKDLLLLIKDARAHDWEDLVLDEIALWSTFAWDDKLLKAEGFEWYAPLRTIALSSDVVRFKKGELRLHGKWLSRSEVEKCDKEHDNFGSPWALEGGWFEIHADLPLERILSTLNHASLWRAHLWGQLSAEMNLHRPEGLLPIFACATRKSLDEQASAFLKQFGIAPIHSHATAFYRNVSPRKLNPIFISLEEIDLNEEICPASEASYFQVLGHEATHQLLTEGVKYKEARSPDGNPDWIFEGMGCWSETWDLKSGRFARRYLRSVPTGRAGTTLPSDLEIARRMKGEFPTFSQFIHGSSADFRRDELRSYAQACLTAHFMLDSGDNELRWRFVRIVEASHSRVCDAKCIDEAFAGIDPAGMDKKLVAFLDAFKLEDR